MAIRNEPVHESTTNTGLPTPPLEHVPGVTRWLPHLTYGVLTALLVVAASVLAVNLATLVPGLAGVAVFLTAGVLLVLAAPSVAYVAVDRTVSAVRAGRVPRDPY